MPSSMNWVDGAAGGTPVSAANLNKLAVVADIGVAGTPTGDAGRGAYVRLHGTTWYAPAPSGGDDGPTLRADLAAAATAGAREYVLDGDYLISSSPGLVYPSSGKMMIRGRRPGDTRIRQGWSAGLFNGFISASGTYADTDITTLSADVGARSFILTLASTASLTVGSYYMLGSDRTFNDYPASTSNDDIRYRGEIVRIGSIDSGTQVTLYGMVRDNYAVTNGASLRPITYLPGVGLADLTLENPNPGTITSDLLKLTACNDFQIDNVRFVGADGCGINLDMSRDGRIDDCRMRDLTDDTVNNRYGYGVNLVRCTEDVVISGLRVERGRHGVTTNGLDNHRGVPRNVTIIGGVSDRSNAAAWDTHAQGANISYVGCRATNCQTVAFQVRAPSTEVTGCHVDFCGQGFEITATGYHSVVKDSVFRRIVRNEASGVGYGAILDSVFNASVERNVFDGSWFANLRLLGATSRTLIRGNTFRNAGIGSGGAAGILVDSAHTGTANRIISNHFESTAATADALSSGTLTYPVDLGAAGASNWYITDNTAVGASQPVFVRDLSTGTTKLRNRQLDRQEDKAVGLAPSGTVAESYSRVGGSIASQAYLSTGRQSFVGVWLEAGQVVTSIAFLAGGTAVATPTNQWFSLYDASRNKLAVTSDDTTTAWAAFARKTLNLTSPYTVPTTGLYYVGINVTAATVPSIGGAGTSGLSTGLTPKLVGFDATNTGLTTPATAPAAAAAFSDISVMPYVVLS